MGTPDGPLRPLPQLGPDGIGHEVSRPELARREQINGVLLAHDLARPFTHVGDVRQGEISLLSAERVVPLASSGLSLVHIPAQFTPDTLDTQSREVVPGKKGAFWMVFQDNDLAAQSQIVVPFVRDAPGNFDYPSDMPRGDTGVDRINDELRRLHLKDLPYPVGASQEHILDIADVIQENERFFSVVVLRTVNGRGEVAERPFLFNAKSDEGIDGTVFAPTVHLPLYGMEPRILMGDNYRPTLGGWVPEVPRGFYSPALGGQNLKIRWLTDTDIPGFRRAVQELGSETGLINPEALKDRGRLRQDPAFEVNEPTLFSIQVKAPQFGPRDLEESEKIKIHPTGYGDFFSRSHEIPDAFTLSAVMRDFLRRGLLRISDEGRKAQESGERLVLARPYRVQYGEYTTEAIRTSLDTGFPIDAPAGELAVNTGIARIIPEVYTGSSSWRDIRVAAQNANINSLRLLYPYEVLHEIATGNLDIVTTAAVTRALHQRGYLQLDYTGLP